MTNKDFKKGQIVMLVSGGPKMAVVHPSYGVNEEVQCQWFAGKKLEVGYFDPETLKHVSEDASTGDDIA